MLDQLKKEGRLKLSGRGRNARWRKAEMGEWGGKWGINSLRLPHLIARGFYPDDGLAEETHHSASFPRNGK